MPSYGHTGFEIYFYTYKSIITGLQYFSFFVSSRKHFLRHNILRHILSILLTTLVSLSYSIRYIHCYTRINILNTFRRFYGYEICFFHFTRKHIRYIFHIPFLFLHVFSQQLQSIYAWIYEHRWWANFVRSLPFVTAALEE